MSDTTESGAVPAWQERKNLLLAGAVGIAVLILAGYFLLSGGSSSDEDYTVKRAVPKVGAQVALPGGAAATPTATPTAVPAVWSEDVYGDPFAPIYPPKPAAAPSANAATTTTNVPATNNQAPAPVAPAEQPVSQPDTTPTEEVVSVELVDVVDENTVKVKVNGQKDVSTFNIGTTFGGYFSVTSTRPDEDEATFKFGDGELFTLAEGDTARYVIS